MRVKLQLVMCDDDGQEETVTDVVTLKKDHRRLEHLGLTLAEAKQLLKTLQHRVLQRQVDTFLAASSTCQDCGSREHGDAGKRPAQIASPPPRSVMHVDDMVDAALVGLDRGETVTMPSLPDIAEWEAYEATRQKMIPKLSRSALALRYDVTSLPPMGAREMSEDINHDRRCFWGPAVITMAAMALASLAGSTSWFASSGAPSATFAEDKRMVHQMTPAAVPLPIEGELPSLGSATAWLNSPPLTAAGLRGKVVLIDFWTYSCINWLRSLPYVRAWAEKYKEQGLVVIGVHTPEFAFEHNIDNVRQAAKDMRVDYPIAIDNGYALWRAFKNQYWPALYVVDAQGHIRHHHFGEGEYAQSERIIQQLLAEAGLGGIGHELVAVEARGAEAAADWDSLQSPETYVGYERTAHFASPGGAVRDQRRVYAAPERLQRNHWALTGDWTVGKQAAVLHKANGRIVYRFHARDLHLVMGPAPRGTSVRFRVRLDGQPPGAAHGIDVDDQGNGTVTAPRLYQLIRQPPPIADRQFEIEFLDTGVEAFVFTFG